MKESPGTAVTILNKARCCLYGDKQQNYRYFDPDSLYAAVALHETLRLLLAKFAARDMLLEVRTDTIIATSRSL